MNEYFFFAIGKRDCDAYTQHLFRSKIHMLVYHLSFLSLFCFQLPDLRYLDCRVDYSTNTFRAVVNLCKDLGIRHPEELSLCKPLEPGHLKKNYSKFPKLKFAANEYENGREYISPAADTNSFIPTHSTHLYNSNGSLDKPHNGTFSCAPVHQTPIQQRANQPISSPTGVSCFLF